MAGLVAGLGRGAMTNHWVDLKNADVIMMDGSNAAENHPAAMTWINKAKGERGAKLIVIDSRFTRSASQADLYVPIRSGTDIAFVGGMIKYIIDKDLYHREYVVHYTNAATLLVPEFKGPADLDGLFSGFVDEDKDGFGACRQASCRPGLPLITRILPLVFMTNEPIRSDDRGSVLAISVLVLLISPGGLL